MDFQITPIENPNVITETPIRRSFWAKHKYKIIIGLFVILVALGFYLYFSRRSPFNESQVTFTIDAPGEITSGQLITYKVNYANNTKIGLIGAKIDFVFPPNAIAVKDGEISTDTMDSADIGDVAAGAEGEKDFSAYVVGDKGNILTARATLSYQAQNFSSTFQTDASAPSTITTLAIPLTLVAPPSIISGQSVTYLLDYRNQSSQDFSDLQFVLKYPDGFKLSSASPQPTSGQDTWDLATLKQNDGARITIQGTLNGNPGDTKDISLILQKKITMPSGDTYVNFEETDATSLISSPFIGVSLKLNDTANYTAHLGDSLNYTIDFSNNSNDDITGLVLTAKLDGQMFDLTSVNSPAFFDSRTNTLTWDQSLIPALALLKSGQHGQASFKVNVKKSFTDNGSSIASSIIKVSAHLETPNVPSDLNTDTLATDDQLTTRISSEPVFDQNITINDSQFGSSGPFPPVVDSTTKFTVDWSLVNPSNDVSPAKVTATLAPGVKWENQVRSANGQPLPVYNSKTNTLTWDLGTLPDGAGVTTLKFEAFFRISITPSVNQVGQSPTLLKGVRFDGTDTDTKEKISQTITDALTTDVSDSTSGGTVQAKP
jgi:uncharacterized repeat protein (TIGR01451 family)